MAQKKIQKIKVPSIGEGIESVVVSEILFDVGQTVEKNDVVAIVSSDKVDIDVVTPVSGKIDEKKINVGDQIKVNSTLLTISYQINTDETVCNDTDKSSVCKNSKDDNLLKIDKKYSGKNYTSPLNRKLLKEYNLNLGDFDDSGYISKEQIVNLSRKRQKAVESAPTQPVSHPDKNIENSNGYIDHPFTAIRKTISEQMSRSLLHTAQLTSFFKLDITNLVKLRNSLKYPEFSKITITPIILKLFISVLKEFPKIKSTVVEHDKELYWREYRDIDVNLAADTSRGLITPIIKGCDKMNLYGFLKSYFSLIEKIKNSNFTKPDMELGCITFSNTGSVGLDFDTPILNYPQSVLIGFGRSKKELTVLESKEDDNCSIQVRDQMFVSVTYDHRIIDGADVGRFAKRVKAALEKDYLQMLG